MKHKAKVKKALERLRESVVEHVVKNELNFPLEDLAGACGICSYLVFRQMRRMGYRPVFHMNDCHCYVTANGYWIDLTLTQFAPDADEVFFHDHPYRLEKRGVLAHERGRRATTVPGIRRMFKEWQDDQNPFKQVLPNLMKLTA